jgi:hypothetical protein
MKPVVRIENLGAVSEGMVSRVSADVDGEPVWFESADMTLRTAPEAFASAFLIPSLAMKAGLAIDAPLSPSWLQNARLLTDIVKKWWGYTPTECDLHAGKDETLLDGTRVSGLLFSGGVDSFYTLLRSRKRIDNLFFIHGYDIRLNDQDRMTSYLPSLQAVAGGTGKRLVVMKTNLRSHPVFSSVPWDQTHGGALAAIGHFSTDFIGRFMISSSYPYFFDRPWGSHWKTDPLWSSVLLEVFHFGAGVWRSDKLRAIADEPLVRKHLRVCHEHLNSRLNCCRCEKCLRTMLVLAQQGKLEFFETFSEQRGLTESLGRLGYVGESLIPVYEDILRRGLGRKLGKAVRCLLARSRERIMAASTGGEKTFRKRAVAVIESLKGMAQGVGRNQRKMGPAMRTENEWDKKALQARISDRSSRKRFEAGSPNETEISAYAAGLPGSEQRDAAVVLGMTPELRALATREFRKVISIDINQDAIDLYTDWVPEERRQSERIIRGNWFDMSQSVPVRVSTVLGDGVFANLPSVEQHLHLLRRIASVLHPMGRFVTRMVFIPRYFSVEKNSAKQLTAMFRRGIIDNAEFGFGMRFLAHYECCYDHDTFLLDNRKLFKESEEDFRAGRLTAEELSCMQRYYYGGKNCIVPQFLWEQLLEEAGFEFTIQECNGKAWYDYYKVYVCSLAAAGSRITEVRPHVEHASERQAPTERTTSSPVIRQTLNAREISGKPYRCMQALD